MMLLKPMETSFRKLWLQLKGKWNSREWFEGEISEAIKNSEKLFKNFEKSRLNIDKEFTEVDF